MSLHPPHPELVLERAAALDLGAMAGVAAARGLRLVDDTHQERAIPLCSLPTVLNSSEHEARTQLARTLAEAVLAVAALAKHPSGPSALAALSPLERRLVHMRCGPLRALALNRIDLVDGKDGLRALEINATIPALPGYADLAAQAFIEGVGAQAGLSAGAIASLVASNGSNARALFSALTEHHAERRRGRSPTAMGLMCRRRDSQLPELAYLASVFRELGVDAAIVHPDQLVARGECLYFGHVRLDLVYRHVFVHRLDEPSLGPLMPFLAYPPPAGTLILNPPAPDVELKATLALLSRAGREPAIAAAAGLHPRVCATIRRHVPWTRVLTRDAEGELPDGTRGGLLRHVSAHAEAFVLKPVQGHGGKGVIVGADSDSAEGRHRAQRWFGAAFAWPDLCALAADDVRFGGWVVQQAVLTTPRLATLATADDARRVPVYRDAATFASPGCTGDPGWLPVCRAAASRVVNISAGGGMAPVLNAHVAAVLVDALGAAAVRRGEGARSSAPRGDEPRA